MNHKYDESLKRTLAIVNDRRSDTNIIHDVKVRMLGIAKGLEEGTPMIKNMLSELNDLETFNEMKAIMMQSAQGGGSITEARTVKLTPYLVGNCYKMVLERRNQYDVLLASMEATTIRMFSGEFYDIAKDTYNCTAFRKIIEEKLLILNHLKMNAVMDGLATLSIAASSETMSLD